jgi:methyltransferase
MMVPSVTPASILIGFIVVQRLAELWLSRRNTRRLVEAGGYEVGAGHYRLIVAVHVAWIATLAILGWNAPISAPWIALVAVLQILRIWVIWSLGVLWTTRIVVVDQPLVRRGPYRLTRHPAYAIAAVELVAVPMALGLPIVAAVYTVLNAAVIGWRIKVENAAIAHLRRAGQRGGNSDGYASKNTVSSSP